MTERYIVIPTGNWSRHLAAAIKEAPSGATIVVHTEPIRELGEIAAAPDRLNRPDLKFIVQEAAPGEASDGETA